MSRLHLGFARVAAAAALAACGRNGAGSKATSIGDAAADSATVAMEAGGVQTTSSGLRMRVEHPGDGSDHPAESDRVKVRFTGWTKDGGVFDSSEAGGRPVVFTLTQMIPGWTEALKLMSPGEKRKLWVPARLAYGEKPRFGAPAGDLTYEIELEEIIHAPERPEDVAGVPKTATVTASGLAYRVIERGRGKVHVRPSDTVVANYSGWTTNGLLFDSSRLRSGPGIFTVSSLIKGWIEALSLMVVGDKMRVWMPANLAYGEHPTQPPDAPAGMLVFDIELLEISDAGPPATPPQSL